ncbi:hypothetical protein [Arthrobacter sp. 2MCAF14]
MNLIAVFLGFAPPIVTMTRIFCEVVPTFLQGLQEAIGVIRTAASK